MEEKLKLSNWYPERFFYSHSSIDSEISQNVSEALKLIDDKLQLYFAERTLVGRPLIEKLREEIINCNAILVGWTKNAHKKSSQIISFEIGMAYSLGLPIYFLKFKKSPTPWFFDKLTDYECLKNNTIKEIEKSLRKIEPFSFIHPIELLIPKETFFKYSLNNNQSKNIDVVNDDGTIDIANGFNGIIHFDLINKRPKAEKNVRLIINFPEQIEIIFDPGSLDQRSKVQRNEIFDMRQTSKGTVRMYWPSLPVEKFRFEIRMKMENFVDNKIEYINCLVSSDSIVGWRNKKFQINLNNKKST